MVKWLLFIVGSMVVTAGMILFWLPIPLGVPLLMIGVPMMMKSSRRIRGQVMHYAQRIPWLHHYLSKHGHDR